MEGKGGKTTKHLSVWWFMIIIPDFGRLRQMDSCEMEASRLLNSICACCSTHTNTHETKGKVGSTCRECTRLWASVIVLHKLGVDVNIPSPSTQAGEARESSTMSSSATYRVQAQPGVHETLP